MLTKRLGEQIIAKFNEQFEGYVGKKDITIYDIMSVINYAQNYNKEAGQTVVDVTIDGTSYIKKKNFNEQAKIDKLQADGTDILYTCTEVEYNIDTKQVNLIKFKTFHKNNK